MIDLADFSNSSYEPFRPLVSGWLAKIESALTCPARKRWKDVADECLMYYNKSAAAMWDPGYAKKFWRGVKAPRFRISVNKAFEYVAVFIPNLLWDVPHRQATPKKALQIPQEAFPDPQMYEQLMQAIAQESGGDKLVAALMQSWLNYTPREMPGNGLEGHNELALLDGMLKGSGHLWPAPYSMPSSDRTLTGCFRRPPEDLIFDPDFKTSQECKWIALKHVDPHWVVERRFKLPAGSLKGKATLESSWHYAELTSTEGQGTGDRKSGKTNDLVVWYEVWSKLGTGARMSGMPDILKNHLEEVVGDYAYLALCPDCPYPLNCPADKIRQGATDAEVRTYFEWPIPLWTDDRWPVERLVFYEDPESPYGVPPLAPALGELKAINAITAWLVNRTWQTSRQMWAVLGQYKDEMQKVLEEGDDLTVFGVPAGSEQDIKKIIQLIEGNPVNRDAWDVYELLSNTFDKRMGMTPFVYGQNEDGTQDRTAETTAARKSAVSARPEYMQKKVVGWQSRVASLEAIIAWLFVKGRDVEPSMGRVGAALWSQYIENAEGETVMRETRYEVAASSIRRPNRDRDISNLQEIGTRYLPLLQAYGEVSGDYQPVNGYMKKWGEQHDMDVDGMLIPAKDENDPNAQLDMQLKQAEAQKMQAEAQKATSEAQQNPAALKAQELQMKGQMDQQKLQMDMQKTEAELKADIIRLQLEIATRQAELQMKSQEHRQELAVRKEEAANDLQIQREKGAVDIAVTKATGAQQIAQGQQQMQMQSQQHKQSMQQTKQQGQLKVAATNAKAKTDIATSKAKSEASIKQTHEQSKARVSAMESQASVTKRKVA